MSWNDEMPWDAEGTQPWEAGSDATPWVTGDTEAWRGDTHLGSWPGEETDPEPWLNRSDEFGDD